MDEVIEALRAAVTAAPESRPLRVHLAETLLAAGKRTEALELASALLREDSADGEALALLRRASATAEVPDRPQEKSPDSPAAPASATDESTSSPAPTPPPADPPREAAPSGTPVEKKAASDGPDWARLEQELNESLEAPFVTGDGEVHPEDLGERSRETLTLADVGGLEEVKERLRVAFLDPMRNPEVARAFGKSLRGGLLLYGPPGTGKTFLARAVAGELGANFLSVTLADVLGGVMGQSEGNVRKLFARARDLAPCVLFIDELDALGGKRSQYSNVGWMRNVVNQLLQEMDGVNADNEGVFVLAATNHPWDVDTALLRPGRLDRTLLVLPPDAPAREAIMRHHLKERPIAGIDLAQLASVTDGFSGADLEHVVASAAEIAMTDSLKRGEVRPIGMKDLKAAIKQVTPSTTPWLRSAVQVVTYANVDGRYDELAAYLRRRKML